MNSIRKPNNKEIDLISILIKYSEIRFDESWRDSIRVQTMTDGNMGSLLLFPAGKPSYQRVFGRQVSEINFQDIDGIDVFASLNLDQNDNLFEIDVWKVNFEPLIELPNHFNENI